ncbi:divergent polysaccharide deacetylase family protein [Nitrobacter sp.]|uniref:divergent polysaccharide deacetylase family protein n=1 Tax=Nitrobacter sp. TaxID=29420 RepID=UPI0029CAB36A|nr:divergent polysaccharide deacetylase family protein [Nitrobacter sp.]
MVDTTDDLSAPLGQNPTPRRRLRLPFTLPQASAVLLGSVLAAFLGFAIFNHDPLGGEPTARVAIRQLVTPEEKPAAVPPASKPASATAAANSQPEAGQKTITIIDGSSGARQNVVVAGGDSAAAGGDVAPAMMAGIDQRLLEKSRYGMIPIAAADGLKPFKAYAMGTDADRAKAATMPAVAIVVGGLGVGAAKTVDAIMKLPSAVTLGFTPYGSDPVGLVERARAQRHEVLLQVPMEPYDYPDNDPGPQTLLTTLGTEQNIDRLYWHLSRFQGYVGVANFMGSRFVTASTVMQPIIREAAKRGLGYLDDGSTPRSVAGQLAGGQAMPFAKADLTIDSVPTSVEIDKALARLEDLAKERGTAIGMASALPVSIDRIGVWAKALEGRGVMLVPLTTAMLKSKSS